ncbi:uncharacterized protein LOC125232683 [Leguminivora glycinivorella]|uniref:uncharacterized protein LOC125232683 n=1 Tax=Leguminivora glycinivorella TaxID=1035111 RepID=UPI00200EC3F3|nr:uncharacterized protein LOC125232683 [Leguminivora glycinivorella]
MTVLATKTHSSSNMGSRNLLASVLGLLLIVNCVTALQWDYYFGTPNEDYVKLAQMSGDIPPFLHPVTYPIKVSPRSLITYVKVTVWSLSAPKVDYDEDTQTVSIVYSLLQVTAASYKIEAYGFINPVSSDGEKQITG